MVTTTFFAIPINVSAEETADFSLGATSGITGDCTWKLDDEGTLTISGNGKMGNYYLVWGAPWERNIKSVIIEKGVTSIGSFAFYRCTSLTNLTISGSVTSIGDYAFSECTSLASVTIPDSVTSIGDDVFYDCTNLTSVTIGDSVTSISYSMFSKCTSLASITIPDSVRSIGSGAFSDCTSLTSVTIGDNVTSIGSYAFSNCTSFANVTIPDSVTNICHDAFSGCISLASVTIGDSVTSIGHYAFWFCQRLSDVYYGGNETQWNKIEIGAGNDCLTSAMIYYNYFTGTLTPVNTNFGSSSQSNSVSVKTPNNSTLNVELEKDLCFTVPSDVSLIGDEKIKLDLSFVPITAAITDNKIRIGIGYNRDLTKDKDEQNWNNWKNYVKGYKDAVSKGKGLLNSTAILRALFKTVRS